MEIFARLESERFIRKLYRMSQESFWTLHSLLEPTLLNRKRKRGATPNGDVSSVSRLSQALHYFAGGEPADIMQTHGVAYMEVYNSVWKVVDAVNSCPELQFTFPHNHALQQQIAAAFKAKSDVAFDNCVGCIDGMLVWTNKPNKKRVLERAKLGPRKFFCGRKHKFGLNFQGVCDHLGRFMDVWVKHPGATSDWLLFITSPIYDKIQTPGFLAEGLAIYGDAAYINAPFMVTPFKGAKDGPQDAFNFFHSQIRIGIECAFGMLVHRWGILRRPIPVNISIAKTASLVRALCILHNFCINQRQAVAESPSASDSHNNIMVGGFTQSHGTACPSPLMDGGEHYEDVPRPQRRGFEQLTDLPRDKCTTKLANLGITQRPKPRGTTSTNN